MENIVRENVTIMREESYYGICDEELNKFFYKIKAGVIKLHQACEKNSVLSSMYNNDKTIIVRAIFTMHPYRPKEQWLLYKTEYLLSDCELDYLKLSKFQSNYPKWYSYFNGNLKGDIASDFVNWELLPTLVITCRVKVGLKEVKVKEGNLFEKPTTSIDWAITMPHMLIEFDLGNMYLGNKWLKLRSKHFERRAKLTARCATMGLGEFQRFYKGECHTLCPGEKFALNDVKGYINSLIQDNLSIAFYRKD